MYFNYRVYVFYGLLTIVLSIIAPLWVAVIFLVTLVFLKAILILTRRITISLMRKVVYVLCVLVTIISLSITFKVFFLGLFRVPSASMENTLLPEDVILVNKLAYGPRLPQFLKEYISDKNDTKSQRLNGMTDIKQGDVIVYQTTKSYNVKRCVGLPGEEFKIIEGEVYADGVKLLDKSTVKDEYVFKTDKLNAIDSEKKNGKRLKKTFKQNLSLQEVNQIKKSGNVENIFRVLSVYDSLNTVFSEPKGIEWTIDNMGPFKIPYEGMNVVLDDYTYEIYRKVIETIEATRLLKERGDYFLDGKQITSYTFKEDYVFFMGDNRKKSIDSRYTGFQPVSSIVGKVELVLYSRYEKKFRWKRLVKTVL